MNKTLETMSLSIRAYNGLRAHGIYTREALLNKTILELLRIKNMGKKSVLEIISKL